MCCGATDFILFKLLDNYLTLQYIDLSISRFENTGA